MIRIPALVMWCGLAVAAEVGPSVAVGGYLVQPEGNLGGSDGAWAIHPTALLGVGYNSNIYGETSPTEDTFSKILVGVQLDWLDETGDSVSVDAEFRYDRYLANPERDFRSGRVVAKADRERDDYDAHVGFEAVQIDDPLIQTGETVRRRVYAGRTAAGLRTAQRRHYVEMLADRQQYLEDAGGFTAAERSYDALAVKLGSTLRTGTDGSWGLRLGGQVLAYESSNKLQDVTVAEGAISRHQPLSDRILAKIELGAQQRSYSDVFAPGFDDQKQVLPIGSLHVGWDWSDRNQLGLRAGLTPINSFSANTSICLLYTSDAADDL
jgi:hypothetical protein